MAGGQASIDALTRVDHLKAVGPIRGLRRQGETMPAVAPDAPDAKLFCSNTVLLMPSFARWYAMEHPITPPPIMETSVPTGIV